MKPTHSLTALMRRACLALGIFLVLMAFGTQAPPVSAASPSSSEDASFLRIMNASPDIGMVTIFVDGAKVVSSGNFATVTDYVQLPAGPHNVQAVLVGKGATRITEILSVQAGVVYSVAALGTQATGFSLNTFVDDNTMARGMAKVRVYDLSPGIGPWSVVAGGRTIASGLLYPQASNYFMLPAGSQTFHMTIPQPPFGFQSAATLHTNRVTSIFVVGSVLTGTSTVQFVNAQVNGVPALSKTGSDPNPLAGISQLFLPLAAWSLGDLSLGVRMLGGIAAALGGLSVVVALGFLPVVRQKTTARFRWLALCFFTAIVAVALVLAGLQLASYQTSPAPPPTAHLLIPAIGVNAPIEAVGVLSDNTLATPTKDPWTDVGWYAAGPRPGEQGSAVINGHLDRPGGFPAAFWKLGNLHVSDKVMVVDPHGKVLHFRVTALMQYSPQDAPVLNIFGNKAGRFLNLTSCTGDWIPAQNQTSLRIVVYTTLMPS